MALNSDNRAKIDEIERGHPQVSIFLQPIAPPAALGLAGFAGSTWITAVSSLFPFFVGKIRARSEMAAKLTPYMHSFSLL